MSVWLFARIKKNFKFFTLLNNKSCSPNFSNALNQVRKIKFFLTSLSMFTPKLMQKPNFERDSYI